jgi:hypothetical protein
MRDFEREYVARALQLAGGKKTRTSQMLGVSRKALWKKLNAYGIQFDARDAPPRALRRSDGRTVTRDPELDDGDDEERVEPA